ncbi:hypothetical protein JCM31598_07140 [Desulfonatronum parangueonense]
MVTAQKNRAMKFPVQGFPLGGISWSSYWTTLQPELCSWCLTPLPHRGAALPGFNPLIAADIEQLQKNVTTQLQNWKR